MASENPICYLAVRMSDVPHLDSSVVIRILSVEEIYSAALQTIYGASLLESDRLRTIGVTPEDLRLCPYHETLTRLAGTYSPVEVERNLQDLIVDQFLQEQRDNAVVPPAHSNGTSRDPSPPVRIFVNPHFRSGSVQAGTEASHHTVNHIPERRNTTPHRSPERNPTPHRTPEERAEVLRTPEQQREMPRLPPPLVRRTRPLPLAEDISSDEEHHLDELRRSYGSGRGNDPLRRTYGSGRGNDPLRETYIPRHGDDQLRRTGIPRYARRQHRSYAVPHARRMTREPLRFTITPGGNRRPGLPHPTRPLH